MFQKISLSRTLEPSGMGDFSSEYEYFFLRLVYVLYILGLMAPWFKLSVEIITRIGMSILDANVHVQLCT